MEVDTSDLPGEDIGATLGSGSPGEHDVRDGALFAFNMFTFIDAGFIEAMAAAQASGEKPAEPPRLDFSKRGAIRSVTDGRYRFSRCFATANTEHHRPERTRRRMASALCR